VVRPIRDGWDFAEAAAYLVQGLTAWYGLVTLGAVAANDVVLLQSAAGGVGLQALTMLEAMGARTIAVVGSVEKREWLARERGLPPSQIIVRDARTFAADLDRALSALGAGGFDLVFDAVSGPYFQPAFARLSPEGRHVVYGAADFMTPGTRRNWWHLALGYLRRPRVDPLQMISDNRSVMGFNLIWLWNKAHELGAYGDALDRVMRMPPLVSRRFTFADVPAAMRHLQSGQSIGKVVVEV
jgi:alcohol dehydrogenase